MSSTFNSFLFQFLSRTILVFIISIHKYSTPFNFFRINVKFNEEEPKMTEEGSSPLTQTEKQIYEYLKK